MVTATMGQPAGAVSSGATPLPSPGFPPRVLIVEDSPSDQRLLVETLVEAGATPADVRCVASLRDARQALLDGAPDCIMLDLSLPDAAGVEAVSVLAAAAPGVPIVVVTGWSADSLVYAAMAEGADEYLNKSDLDPARLHDLVVRAAERRRGHARFRFPGPIEDAGIPAVAIDGVGRIVAANATWSRLAAERHGDAVHTGPGVNYLTVCDLAVGPWCEGAERAAAGIRAVLGGTAEQFDLDYPCPSDGVERWFSMRVTPVGPLGGGAVISHREITESRLVEQQLRAEHTESPLVLDDSAPIFAVVDRHGRVKHRSELTSTLLGLDDEMPFADQAFDRIVAADRCRAQEAFGRVLMADGARERITVRVVDSGGRQRHLDLTVTNLSHDPVVEGVVVSGSDITASRRTQITARLQSRLLQRLPAAVVVTDEEGIVSYWNDRAAALFDFSPDQALGRPITELNIGPTGKSEAEAIMASVMATGRWEGDYDARRADGSVIPIHATLERVDDNEIDFHGIVGASVDISERRRLEEDLAFQALHDPLTGLPNRRLFVGHVEHTLARSARSEKRVALLFIDLDDFKSVNDRVGHVAADEILVSVGDLIRGVLPTGDVVSRLGGDEFVVCCDEVEDLAEVYEVTGRIRRALGVPFRCGEHMVTITASIGVAMSGARSRAETLLRNADAAMYAAKNAGKDRVELFDDDVLDQLQARRAMVRELEDALASGAVKTYFQPEVDLRSGAIVGFEALARWSRADGSSVSPAEFILLAEQSGLIGELGEHVLRDSCRALAGWLDAAPERPLKVAVNVSGIQLLDPGFPQIVARIIAESGVPAGRVCLEVTESALVEADLAAAALRRLKAIGVEIAIDDFGTGYSSLSRLHHYPLDYLKIDRSFVAGMTARSEDAVIVTAVLGLTQALGLRTIAEGIEDVSQLLQLRAAGCDVGQGYLWSKAVSLDDATLLVESAEPFPLVDLSCETGADPVAVPMSSRRDEAADEIDASTAIAVLAHELVGPISSLAGHAEILEIADDSATRESSLEAMRRAVTLTRATMDLVRDVAALDAGTLILDRTPVRVLDVIADVLAVTESRIDQTVSVDVPDTFVDGDASRIFTILHNLVTNAGKHAPAGSIRIVGEMTDGRVVLHVIDGGPGVPADKVGMIFRKFGRADRTTRGSGLGLYLARGLARAHGGELTYRQAPGGGADFVLELPVAAG